LAVTILALVAVARNTRIAMGRKRKLHLLKMPDNLKPLTAGFFSFGMLSFPIERKWK